MYYLFLYSFIYWFIDVYIYLLIYLLIHLFIFYLLFIYSLFLMEKVLLLTSIVSARHFKKSSIRKFCLQFFTYWVLA